MVFHVVCILIGIVSFFFLRSIKPYFHEKKPQLQYLYTKHTLHKKVQRYFVLRTRHRGGYYCITTLTFTINKEIKISKTFTSGG